MPIPPISILCHSKWMYGNREILSLYTPVKSVNILDHEQTQPLMQVMVTTYLGVVLTDDHSCVKDVERAKIVFFKQFNSLNHKFCFLIKIYCCIFSNYTKCRFKVLKPGIWNLIKKTWKTFPCHTIMLSNVIAWKIIMIVIMSALIK